MLSRLGKTLIGQGNVTIHQQEVASGENNKAI